MVMSETQSRETERQFTQTIILKKDSSMVIELQIKKKKSEFFYYVSHRLFLSHLKGKSSQDRSCVKQSANLYLFCGNAN